MLHGVPDTFLAAATGPSPFPPTIGGTNPLLYADFVAGNYYAAGAVQPSLAAFLTATGAFYNAPTAKYVINASGLLTAITPSLSALPFNYAWNGSAGVLAGLLLELTATNEVLQSNTFSTTWTRTNCTVAKNVTGPDGAANSAWTLTATATGAATAGQTARAASYTLAVYAKAGTDTFLVLGIGGHLTYFNLSTGAVGTNGNTTATITPLAAGWYKCSISQVTPSATIVIGGADANGTNSMTAGRTVLIFGAQAENTGVATSYIPTTTAVVQRASDDFQLVPSGGFSVTAVTLFGSVADFPNAVAQFNGVACLNDATTNNKIDLRLSNSPAGGWFDIESAGVSIAGSSSVLPVTVGGPNKCAVSASVAAGAVSVFNAGTAQTGAVSAMPVSLTNLQIGDLEGSPGFYTLCGDLTAIGTWNVAATAAQLQALTT